MSTDALYFFAYQLAVAALELMVMRQHSKRSLAHAWPSLHAHPKVATPHVAVITIDLWRFAATAGATAALWIAVTQVDRLILSVLLPLAQFGYFSLAVLVASALFVASTPITTVLMARLSVLHADGNEAEMHRLYRTGTQVMAVVCLPLAGVYAVLAGPMLWMLTGNRELAEAAQSVLAFYAIGNACLVFAMCPYLLLYARGQMGLHVIGQLMLLGLLAPAMTWAAHQGGIGSTGPVWLACNALYLLVWVPVMHRRHWPGMHLQWLARDIGSIALPVLLVSTGWEMLVTSPPDRLSAALQIVALGSLLLVIAVAASPVLRRRLLSTRRRLSAR